MYKALNQVTGIPCDIHMVRMFNSLKWCETKSNILCIKQVMLWLPGAEWRELNHIYAGLGQLLNASESK